MTPGGVGVSAPLPLIPAPRCYGPEFAGRLLDHWAYLNKVEIDFSRQGTPTDNAFIEAFNARLRAEWDWD